MRCEVLRRRSIRIRLAFLGRLGVEFILNGRLLRVLILLEMLTFFRGVCVLVRSLLVMAGFFRMKLFVVWVSLMLTSAGQRFARKEFDRGSIGGGQRWSQPLWLLVRLPVIVIFQVFENVADVEESIAIETNVHESRLHAGENAGDFTFVDAADEREFFLALDVNFD
jgi:hypothetical protein